MRTASRILLSALVCGLLGVSPAPAEAADGPSGTAWHSFVSNANPNPGDGAIWYFSGMGDHTRNNDLWKFVPFTTTWTKITPKSKKNPMARVAHAASYDTAQDLYIIFGGNLAPSLDDTWFYNPATNRWSSSTGCADGGGGRGGGKKGGGGTKGGGKGPEARWFAAMAYNPVTESSTLFGGSNSQLFGDTWTLQIIDGKACWKNEESTNGAPTHRAEAAMAYVPIRGTVVLYGGYDRSNPPQNLSDLWEWNGTTWVEILQSGGPLIHGHSLAFDEVSGQMVVFGGQLNAVDDSEPSTSVFFYDFVTNTWSEQLSPINPPRAGAPVAYDNETGFYVRFGGTDGNIFFDDTVTFTID